MALFAIIRLDPAAGDDAPVSSGPEDAPPILRVLVPPDRLATELERVRQGVLVQLPRAEFEQRVQRATRAAEAAKHPPKLIEARYHAVLRDAALIGTAQWRIANPAAAEKPAVDQPKSSSLKHAQEASPTEAPRVLPLEPFNLSIRQARWPDGKDAVLGKFDGSNEGLLLQQPGDRSLSLEWSARGNSLPGEIHFNLEVPAAAVATLDLELPADRAVTVVGDGLLTGPLPTTSGQSRRWRISFAGRSQLNLEVRRQRGPDRPPPRIFTRSQLSEYVLPPGQGGTDSPYDAKFTFDLELRDAAIQTLICECDPALQPQEVILSSLESWKLQRGSTPSAPSVLTIQTREPFKGGMFQFEVRCLALWASRERWTCPKVTLVAAYEGFTPGPKPSDERSQPVVVVPRVDNVVLHVHPDFELNDWQPGAYRLAQSSFGPNGWHMSTLTPGLDAGIGMKRPSAQLRPQESRFRVRQVAWWQIGPSGSLMTVQLSVDVQRGRLFRLPLLLPAGWEADAVELSRPELLRSSATITENGRQLVTIALKRALAPAQELGITLQLRAPLTVPPAGTTLAFPDVVPLGASLREGALAISMNRAYQATAAASIPASMPEIETPLPGGDEEMDRPEPGPSPTQRSRPWGKETPDYYYSYRGREVAGTIALRPHPPELSARCESEVVVAAGKAAVVTRLYLQPVAGSTAVVDVLISGPIRQSWNWRTVGGRNQVKAFTHLPAPEAASPLAALGARSALEAMNLFAAWPRQVSSWRLTLAEPLREPLVLETRHELAGRPSAREAAGHLTLLAGRDLLAALALASAAEQTSVSLGREKEWDVPLVLLQPPHRTVGQVNLRLPGGDVVGVQAVGLREATPRPGPDSPPPWRALHYEGWPLSLGLRAELAPTDLSSQAIADRVLLTIGAEPSGRLLHNYRFTVWNWRQHELTIRLPGDATVLTAKVDGRWIERLKFLRPPESGGSPNGQPTLQLLVPVTAGHAAHHFQIVYSRPARPWRLWAQLEGPAPELPVRTVASFQRAWRLPPGVVPLTSSGLRRMPGRGRAELTNAGLERWRDAPINIAHRLFPAPTDELVRQRQLLADSISKIQHDATTPGQPSIWHVLDRLAFECASKKISLLVDVAALREAGAGPSTPTRPLAETAAGAVPSDLFWVDSLPLVLFADTALVAVPGRVGPLITTRRQLSAWQSAGGPESSLPEAIDNALTEAGTSGHDASRRFYQVIDWLEQNRDAPELGWAALSRHGGRPADDRLTEPWSEDWTEWEPLPGTTPVDSLLVVRADSVQIGGLVLAAIIGLLIVNAFAFAPRWSSPLVLFWLAASALALLWLPAHFRGAAQWPALAAILGAAWWCVRLQRTEEPGRRSDVQARTIGATPVTGAILTLATIASLPGQAAAPAPMTVLIVPDATNAPEKQTVLAPPKLLDELEAIARRGAGVTEQAVLAGAQYEGQIVGATAEFTAKFSIYCLTDKPVAVSLPLGKVQLLDDALLDGARLFPMALRPPNDGYAIKVQGRGMHTATLRFSVSLQSDGDDRELKFTVPQLPKSRLKLRVPAGASFLDVVSARGAQHAVTDYQGPLSGVAGMLPAGPLHLLPFLVVPAAQHLDADLGPIKALQGNVPIHVRWRQETHPIRPVKIEVQEAYYWDLQPEAARLLAVLQYDVSQAAARQLAVSLPANLEVRSVEAGPPPDGTPGPRLLSWSLADGKEERQLLLEFQGAVTGALQVTLELVPRQPFGSNAVLPFPKPLGVQAQQEGILAFRVQNLEAAITEFRAITGSDLQGPDFAAKFERLLVRPWSSARRESVRPPTNAFSTTPGGTPFLRLQLRQSSEPVRCVQEVAWRLGPGQAEVRATTRIISADPGPALWEWELPADVAIADVSGRDVRYWSRSGPRLQIWLQGTRGQTEIQMTGWLARPEMESFVLPALVPLSADAATTIVRITAGEGLSLIPVKLQGLWPTPDAAPSALERNYIAPQLRYGGVFQVRPAPAAAGHRQVSVVELRDGQLAFTTHVEAPIRADGSHALTLKVRNWEGAALRLRAGQVERVLTADKVQRLPNQEEYLLEPASGATSPVHAERRYVLELQPGVHGTYRFSLTGSVPLGSAAELSPPDVRVAPLNQESARGQQWLVLAGTNLVAHEMAGVAPADANQVLEAWPDVWERHRQAPIAAWHVAANDWRLRIRPRAGAARGGRIQVFLAEHSAAVTDGRHWLHQARYWLAHEATANLGLELPIGARVLTATVDGRGVPVFQQGPQHLWLPLSGGGSSRTIRLMWAFDEDQESLHRPRLDQPRVDGRADGPVLWRIDVPPGYRLEANKDAPDQSASRASPAGQELRRAAAFLQLYRTLASRAKAGHADEVGLQLAAAGNQFQRFCKYAEERIALSANTIADQGPQGQPLAAWREELLQQFQQEAAGPQAGADLRPADEPEPDHAVPESGGNSTGPATALDTAPTLLERGRSALFHGEASGSPLTVELTPEATIRWRETWVLSAIAVGLVLAIGAMSSVFGTAAWPERLALLGILGLVALGPESGWLFLLLPLAWICIRTVQGVWRLFDWLRPAGEAPGSGVSPQ
ncbi:MAG TPA: hypothetical protein VKI65_14780 [Gemmataceae bacterium]|nr:hypothetical protein [Gemmataceae bacterium]